MKRIISLLLMATMLLSLATGCGTTDNKQTASYIAAPYTVGSDSELTAEFLNPVFYKNEDGPTIGVTLLGVISQDGKYFRDLDNDHELDEFEDWRLDAQVRAEALAKAMSVEQLTHTLFNVMAYSPLHPNKADVVDENGKPVWTKMYPSSLGWGVEETPDVTNIEMLNQEGFRTFVLRNNPETEVAVWFNNGLEQYSEYAAINGNQVAIPYFCYTNPIKHGLPNSEGVTAAALGAGNADKVLEDAQLDRIVMLAKGIDGLYGPQVDIASDPRWSRNASTYGEREDMSSEIARNLVLGYQNGDKGMLPGSILLTIKHFPGDGSSYNGFESHAETGRYRIYSVENSLANYQLKPFIAAFEAGVAGVMPGYSQPIVDARIAPQKLEYNGKTYDILYGGRGNAFNEGILQGLLRGVLGFDGLINSDSLNPGCQQGVEDLTNYERIVSFVKSGNDCGVISFKEGKPIEYLEAALDKNELSREDLERSAVNRMKVQIQSGNLDNPYRDMEESIAAVNEVTPKVEALAKDINLGSVVLMKNSENTLPMKDTSKKVYVHGFNQKDDAKMEGMVTELQNAGFTVVDNYADADIAYLRVTPTIEGTGSSKLAVLDLVADVETPIFDNNAKRTSETAIVTTVAGMDEFQKIANAVHANGGKVVGEINASNPWILTEMEPFCDALVGTFVNTDESITKVVTGEHNPTGKLPLTMVADKSVIALVETDLDGEIWDVCVSPNDVPGYVKDQHMSAEVLANSPSGSYAYKDAAGNLYVSGFGLSY